MPNLKGARKRYARMLRRRAHLHNRLLIRAFAEVPREHYLGPPPWKILVKIQKYQTPRKTHPRYLYRNVLVGIIPERGLNNGLPSALAGWFDKFDLKRGETVVHIGCGTGYYSAILAHAVGPGGRLVAIEIDDALAPRAKQNLAALRHVEVIHGDGGAIDLPPADAIFVNAGANYPRAPWLEALKSGGRLIFPLITMAFSPLGGRLLGGWGAMILIKREAAAFDAKAISRVGIFPCIGGVTPEADKRVLDAFRRGDIKSLKSLRRDAHQQGPSCWLHNNDACLSTEEVATA